MANKYKIGDFLNDVKEMYKEQVSSFSQEMADTIGEVCKEGRKGIDAVNWDKDYNSVLEKLNVAIETGNQSTLNEVRKQAGKLLDSTTILGTTSHYRRGKALLLLSRCAKNDAEARLYLIRAMGVNDKDIKDEAKDNYETITKTIISSNFIESYKPAERPFLFFVNNLEELVKCYDEEEQIKWVFTNKDYPSSVAFPTQFPETYGLYISHPVLDGYYIKFAGAEGYLFNERFKVITRILKGLGAKRIEITFNNEEYVGEASSMLSKIGLTLKNVSESYSGSHSRKETKTADKKTKTYRTLVAECTPTVIEVPEDLQDWYRSDKEIAYLVKSRMDVNETNTEHIEISSEDLLNLNSFVADKVKASYTKMMTTIAGDFKLNRENSFLQIKKNKIAINVEYATKNEIDNRKKGRPWYKIW